MPNPGGREPRDFLLSAARKKPAGASAGFWTDSRGCEFVRDVAKMAGHG